MDSALLTSITDKISDVTLDLSTVFGAVVGVVATVFLIKKIYTTITRS